MMNVDLQDLTPLEIHVWRVPLIATVHEIATLSHCLSKGEEERLDRFSSHLARDRRCVAWGSLRFILARYLDCSPREIQIVREGLGRPEISYPNAAGLSFSLSHSEDFGLVAVSNNAVGVDIERVDPKIDAERVAERFFSPGESEKLRGLPRDEKTVAFFRLWVLKEAYLKAHGETVPAGLSKYEFALEPNGPCLCGSDFEAMSNVCVLAEIPVSTGYVAALAGLQEKASISIFDL